MTNARSGFLPVDNARRGIVMMVAATALWTIGDAGSKWLAERYPVFQILFMRNVFAFVPILWLVQRHGGWPALRTSRLPAQLGRGTISVIAFGLYMLALPMMPLANVSAVINATPLFVTALSLPLLGERIAARQWIAVIVGFAAVLFMLRPGGDFDALASGLLIACNVLYACFMITTRRLGRTESALAMSFFTAVVALATSAVAASLDWAEVLLADLALVAGIGLLTGMAQYCTAQAFRLAAPATAAPFEYTNMIWAVVLGILVWGDWPSWSVVAGAVVIIASGIAILRATGTPAAA